MLLNFIDSSLQASAKQQAQITLVWKKTPQPFSGSVCDRLIKEPKSCWCGRLCWSRAVLCNRFVHLRTPSNLKECCLTPLETCWLSTTHTSEWELADKSCPPAFHSLYVLPVRHKMAPIAEFKAKRASRVTMFIYFILKHQKKSKQSAKSVCNKLNFT